jgi:hypothetical protein
MRYDDRHGGQGLVERDGAVVSEAAAAVAAAVRMALADALRAADRCGCRRCRQRAAATVAWAVEFLEVDRAVPAPGIPQRWPWR